MGKTKDITGRADESDESVKQTQVHWTAPWLRGSELESSGRPVVSSAPGAEGRNRWHGKSEEGAAETDDSSDH